MDMRRSSVATILLLACGVSEAELHIEVTPERIARGEYLVMVELGCSGCHSERDRSRYGFPPKEGGVLAGGVIFSELSEEAVSPNITPFALGTWTDEEIFDAITRGVRPDGRVLDPHMPYQRYGLLEEERIHEIIAYLRSIEPIAAGPYPADFPGEHIAFEPQFGALRRPDSSASETELGAYLVAAAGCNNCHLGTDGGALTGKPFAGGREFGGPGIGLIRAANLTPDIATGLGGWTREAFLARFEGMRGSRYWPVKLGEPNTTMHWWQYSDMTQSDLSAIYAYLRTLPPVRHSVVRFEPRPGEAPVSRSWSERVSTVPAEGGGFGAGASPAD
jgi:mono/diheme cytochrome c family protein